VTNTQHTPKKKTTHINDRKKDLEKKEKPTITETQNAGGERIKKTWVGDGPRKREKGAQKFVTTSGKDKLDGLLNIRS